MNSDERLSRTAASAAVESIGWRFVLGRLATSVTAASLRSALDVAAAAVGACGDEADEHLRVDVRADRVELVLQPRAKGWIDDLDVALAHSISAAVREIGGVTASRPAGERAVQVMEIAIDTLDRAAIRPFWRAVLGYVDPPGSDDPNVLVDPVGQGPALWFQQMDVPRPQRNRVHFDIAVPHDEAESRILAALDAGGTLLSDARARAFWILADAEGNEVCVCTWQDRDPE